MPVCPGVVVVLVIVYSKNEDIHGCMLVNHVLTRREFIIWVMAQPRQLTVGGSASSADRGWLGLARLPTDNYVGKQSLIEVVWKDA